MPTWRRSVSNSPYPPRSLSCNRMTCLALLNVGGQTNGTQGLQAPCLAIGLAFENIDQRRDKPSSVAGGRVVRGKCDSGSATRGIGAFETVRLAKCNSRSCACGSGSSAPPGGASRSTGLSPKNGRAEATATWKPFYLLVPILVLKINRCFVDVI